jgi:predicted transcriptional regulator
MYRAWWEERRSRVRFVMLLQNVLRRTPKSGYICDVSTKPGVTNAGVRRDLRVISRERQQFKPSTNVRITAVSTERKKQNEQDLDKTYKVANDVREYGTGNLKWTIQRNWQHRVHMAKKNKTITQHNMCWTPRCANKCIIILCSCHHQWVLCLIVKHALTHQLFTCTRSCVKMDDSLTTCR